MQVLIIHLCFWYAFKCSLSSTTFTTKTSYGLCHDLCYAVIQEFSLYWLDWGSSFTILLSCSLEYPNAYLVVLKIVQGVTIVSELLIFPEQYIGVDGVLVNRAAFTQMSAEIIVEPNWTILVDYYRLQNRLWISCRMRSLCRADE